MREQGTTLSFDCLDEVLIMLSPCERGARIRYKFVVHYLVNRYSSVIAEPTLSLSLSLSHVSLVQRPSQTLTAAFTSMKKANIYEDRGRGTVKKPFGVGVRPMSRCSTRHQFATATYSQQRLNFP